MAEVTPQPTPTMWGFDTSDDGRFVVMVAQTPVGQFVHFIMYENIDNIVAAMQQMQRQCDEKRTGAQPELVVPGQVLLGPGGEPVRMVPPSNEVEAQARRDAMREQVIDGGKDEPPPGDEDAGRRGD